MFPSSMQEILCEIPPPHLVAYKYMQRYWCGCKNHMHEHNDLWHCTIHIITYLLSSVIIWKWFTARQDGSIQLSVNGNLPFPSTCLSHQGHTFCEWWLINLATATITQAEQVEAEERLNCSFTLCMHLFAEMIIPPSEADMPLVPSVLDLYPVEYGVVALCRSPFCRPQVNSLQM